MDWVDAHVHIGEDDSGPANTVEETVELFKEGHLDRAVVFCFDEADGIRKGNARVREAVQDEDRFAALFRVDPAVHEPADLKDADWAAGFKMHPRSQDFELEDMGDYFDVVADTGKPALVHTGIWREHTHPERVVEAVSEREDVDFVLAHNLLGYYYNASNEFKQKLQGLDHVHLDLSIHVTPHGTEILVRDLGADRLLFASDFPYGHPLPMRQNIELAEISEEELEKIAGGNAERLFF